MPAISPRTQAMGQMGGTDDQAKALFDQGLSQMAYNVLLSKMPNVAQDVVTFKVLDTDHEEGSGVGAFVLSRRGQTLYVPVVMADNQIKPLDILYHKDLNVFLPLTKDWLAELDKQSMGEMGQGVTPPKMMPTDVDIRNTVVPPTTGRYSYASDRSTEQAIKQAGRVFDEARVHEDTKLAFLDFLRQAPNRVKKAAAKLFETRPKLLKHAVYFYGEKPLVESLKLADYGGGIKNHGGALYVVDDKTPTQEFKDIFGSKSPAAFSGVKVKGYYAKDTRTNLNRALAVQPYLDLQAPKDSGAYKLWKTDGTPVVALIIANPIDIFGDSNGKRIPPRNIRFRPANLAPADPLQGQNTRYRVPGKTGYKNEVHVDRYIGITESGDLIDAGELMGTQVSLKQLEGSSVFQKTVGEASAAGPRKGQQGIFVQKRGGAFIATAPVTIETVSNDARGVKRIEVSGAWGRKTLVVDPNSPASKLMVPLAGDLVYLPADFVWFPANNTLTQRDFLTTPKDIFNWTTNAMQYEGAEKVKVSKYTGEPGFLIGNEYAANFPQALKKLAMKANIGVEDAEYALKQASEHGRFAFWTMSPEKYEKVASVLKVSESGERVKEALGPVTASRAVLLAGTRAQTPAGKAKVLNQVNRMERRAYHPGDMHTNSGAGRLVDDLTSDPTLLRFYQTPAGQERLQRLYNRNNTHTVVREALRNTALGRESTAAEQPQPDPAQQAMDQMQAAQMQQPQGPSPVDMAVAEQMQNIQAQMTALQQMQQMVQTIQQRASMIASGGGAGAAPAAAAAAMGGPMDPSMMGAGAPVPGMGGQPGGMDPSMMGGQPGMAGGQPGGMDPSMMGQDPNAQQQQPPSAMMSSDDGSMETLMQQINPQFMEQAGELNDAGAFDAAALASMSQNPSLKELVAGYLPNLEKSLDNLGRVLLTLWMDEVRIKDEIGDEAYIGIEDNLRSTFRGMGELILKINQNTSVLNSAKVAPN